MTVEQYLERLKLTREQPSLDYLTRLQRQHLHRIPFENLSVAGGEEIVLENGWLLDKILGRGRGGFCYELNGAFAWLLRQLGFPVRMVSAQVFTGERLSPPFDHMALLVDIEQETYLVDVGFGDSFRSPMRMPAGETSGVEGSYRVRMKSREPARYAVEKQDGETWKMQYLFDPLPREFHEYEAMCRHQQNSPDSHFRRGFFCTRATSDGRITLSQDGLTVTQDGTKKLIPASSREERLQMLRQHFDLDPDQLAESV